MSFFGTEKTRSLLDIPEELILNLFSYLTDHVVHFQVRSVCRKLKVLAEHHVQTGKMFENITTNICMNLFSSWKNRIIYKYALAIFFQKM